MEKNNSKSDMFLKVFLYIGFLGIAVFFIIFASIFFKDRFTRLEDYKYNYTLLPGFYEVGVHIPVGTYVLQMEECEEAEFIVYKMKDSQIQSQRTYYVYDNKKGEKDIIKRPNFGFSVSRLGGGVTFKKKIKNITLEEGQILYIVPQTSFIFYSNEVEEPSLKVMEVVEQDISIATGAPSMAGEEFPAGVYDIFYEPKDSAQAGTIRCAIKDIDSIYSSRGYTFDCEGANGTKTIAHGIPFTPGSTIYVGNLDEIRLVPTKYISKTFNSLTWEAETN